MIPAKIQENFSKLMSFVAQSTLFLTVVFDVHVRDANLMLADTVLVGSSERFIFLPDLTMSNFAMFAFEHKVNRLDASVDVTSPRRDGPDP